MSEQNSRRNHPFPNKKPKGVTILRSSFRNVRSAQRHHVMTMEPWWVPSNSHIPNCSTQFQTLSDPAHLKSVRYADHHPGVFRNQKTNIPAFISITLFYFIACHLFWEVPAFSVFLTFPLPFFVFIYNRFHVTQVCIGINILFTVLTHDFSTHVSIGTSFPVSHDFFVCLTSIILSTNRLTCFVGLCVVVIAIISSVHSMAMSALSPSCFLNNSPTFFSETAFAYLVTAVVFFFYHSLSCIQDTSGFFLGKRRGMWWHQNDCRDDTSRFVFLFDVLHTQWHWSDQRMGLRFGSLQWFIRTWSLWTAHRDLLECQQ